MTGPEITGSGILTIVMMGISAFFAVKTRGEAAWRTSSEANEALIKSRDLQIAELKSEISELKADNKSLNAKAGEQAEAIAKLEARPNYLGIQEKLQEMVLANTQEHKLIVEQLTALNGAMSTLAERMNEAV